MFGKKSEKKIVDNYKKAAEEYQALLTQQLYDEYRMLVASMAAICKREGDLWVYDRELPDIDVNKFDVTRDDENEAFVFGYKE